MNTQKLATLSIDSNLRPILVLDPGSHLAIGKVVRALKQMRSGLWPKYLGDTDILITSSAGKENEIYKLAATLTAKGYLLQETEEHKNLDQKLAARAAQLEAQKAAIQERVAKAAIPPRGFAAKRFKWSLDQNYLVARFAQKSAFLAWANNQGLTIVCIGEHRAVLPIEHLPWLQASGIVPQFRALPPAEFPAEPAPVERPDSTWTRDQLKKWCDAQGLSTLGLTRKAQILELIQEVQQ